MKQHYQGLGHIAVYTADMDASIAFYEKIGGSLHLRAPACPPEQQRELLVQPGQPVLLRFRRAGPYIRVHPLQEAYRLPGQQFSGARHLHGLLQRY